MSPIPKYGSGRTLDDVVLRYLEWVPEVKVQVTMDGFVTLTGVVYSEAVRTTAGEVAKAIPGVRAVANKIEVQPLFAAIPGEVARAAERSKQQHEIKMA